MARLDPHPTPTVTPDLVATIRACLNSVLDALPEPSARVPALRAGQVINRPVLVNMHPMRRTTDQAGATRPPQPGRSPERPQKAPRTAYRPRVVYHVTTRRPPTRVPLPATEAAVYGQIQKHPGIAARMIQTTLKLRDGQLWGAVRRLTLAKLIRTAAPK